MTLYVPLSGTDVLPSSPATLKATKNHKKQLERTAHAIAKAKRIVVVSGAGVSVQAGISDFRSSTGLFKQLKKAHAKDYPVLSSGRELFDASTVFHSETTASLFYKMIARLSHLASQAEPTPFHHLLKSLDERGQLLRCYTQNIDCIEEKAGLSFGVPELLTTPRRSPKKPKLMTTAASSSSSSLPTKQPTNNSQDSIVETATNASSQSQSLEPDAQPHSHSPSPAPGTPDVIKAVANGRSTPPVGDTTPRCIPLHGTLKLLRCLTCGAQRELASVVSTFEDGSIPWCVQCTEFEHTRQLVGKRLRGVGVMRPSVVLYNEDHPEGDRVGLVVKKDLTGGRTKRAPPDLLLVVGTSLKVPGTKRIVKEFSKAARSGCSSFDSENTGTTSTTTTRTSRRALRSNKNMKEEEDEESEEEDDDRPIRSIYLNLDFPMPSKEWESTFDVWIQGDLQEFVGLVNREVDKQDDVKKARGEARRAKVERASLKSASAPTSSVSSSMRQSAGEKRKRDPAEEGGGTASEQQQQQRVRTAGLRRLRSMSISGLLSTSPIRPTTRSVSSTIHTGEQSQEDEERDVEMELDEAMAKTSITPPSKRGRWVPVMDRKKGLGIAPMIPAAVPAPPLRAPEFTPFAIAVVPKVEPAKRDEASLAARREPIANSLNANRQWQQPHPHQGQGGSRPTSGGHDRSAFPPAYHHHNHLHHHSQSRHIDHTPMRPRSFSNVCPSHSNPNPNQSVAPPQIELFKPALPRLPSLSQMLPRGAFPLLAQTLSSGGYSRQGGGDGMGGESHHHKRRRTGSYGAFPMDTSDGRSSAGWTLSPSASRRDAGSGVVMVDALV
ncbi:DHS-like NAD/FAD-binding domain-containing protein [Serendipita vermifera]|nr:DHS-like NAD/FAD-binding domain-containing protein [Serendipita vermifera]